MSAHAIQINQYGLPDVLKWTSVELPELKSTEIRIRTIAAAVNHTDLEIRAGNWPIRKSHPFPYVPGVEAVGDVVEVGAEITDLDIGDLVITMMQGMGGVRAERPGGYAEFVTVDADTVAKIPASTDAFAMAAFGLGAVTAYEGLRRIGSLIGKRILVTGAAGGVGSAAVAIAKAQGASVVGAVSRVEQVDYVRGLGADEVKISAPGQASAIEALSVNGVLDTVGEALFPTSLAALLPGGVFSLVGAVGGSNGHLDLWDLIKPITLTGYSSETLDGPALRRAISDISSWLADGRINAPASIQVPLADAHRAHALLERKGQNGRLILVP